MVTYSIDMILSVGYRSLIKQAKTSIVLIDNYINVDTLTMLSNRAANVSATIYTCQLSQQQQLDILDRNMCYLLNFPLFLDRKAVSLQQILHQE